MLVQLSSGCPTAWFVSRAVVEALAKAGYGSGSGWHSPALSLQPNHPAALERRDYPAAWDASTSELVRRFTVRLSDEEAADAEALAGAEGTSLNETVRRALAEAVERRRRDPAFKARVRRIIKEDRELLERLAR